MCGYDTDAEWSASSEVAEAAKMSFQLLQVHFGSNRTSLDRESEESQDVNRLQLTAIAPPSDEQIQTAPAISSKPHQKLGCVNADVIKHSSAGNSSVTHLRNCDYLSWNVTDQLSQVIGKNDIRRTSWTVIDQSYSSIARDQMEQLKAVGFEHLIFVSIEPEDGFAQNMCDQGLAVIDFRPEYNMTLVNKNEEPIDWTLKLRVARAKFVMPMLFLQHGLDNMFTEMDVFWLQNPTSEFLAADRVGKQSSITFGAHADNPFAINIGMWFMRGDAPTAAADLFREAFEILRRHSTTKNGDMAYEVFDQQVLQKVLAMRTSIVDSLWQRPQGTEPVCHTTQFSWCEDLKNAEIDENILIRVLDNYRIATSMVPEYDESVLAVHIVGSVPLTHATHKILLAKMSGVFTGVPTYYEREPSNAKYIAWEGLVKSAEAMNGYAKKHETMYKLIPLLLKLGLATGRTVILPQELDISHQVWNAEELTDVYKLQQVYGRRIQLRESTFLYNRHLHPDNMYPIAQIAVGPRLWAGMKLSSTSANQSNVSYINLGDQSGVTEKLQALVAMLEDTEVKNAKTLVLSIPLQSNYDVYFDDVLDSETCKVRVSSLTRDSFDDNFACRKAEQRRSIMNVGSLCAL